MCYNLLLFINALFIFLTLTDGHATIKDCESLQEQKSCRACSQTSLVRELARRNTLYQSSAPQDSFFTVLQQESLQKVENLQNDPVFQEIVTELQDSASKSSDTFKDPSKEVKSELYIFVSFSLGEKALLNLAQDAKRFGATLVLRGFHQGSYVKTAQALQNMITKTGQGVVIDSELYSLFNIASVPTFVLAKPFPIQAQERIQTLIHDKLQGHVSTYYALETFEKEGDLKDESQALLSKGVSK